MVPVPIWEAPVQLSGRWGDRRVTGTGFAEFMQRGDPTARRLYQSGAAR